MKQLHNWRFICIRVIGHGIGSATLRAATFTPWPLIESDHVTGATHRFLPDDRLQTVVGAAIRRVPGVLRLQAHLLRIKRVSESTR